MNAAEHTPKSLPAEPLEWENVADVSNGTHDSTKPLDADPMATAAAITRLSIALAKARAAEAEPAVIESLEEQLRLLEGGDGADVTPTDAVWSYGSDDSAASSTTAVSSSTLVWPGTAEVDAAASQQETPTVTQTSTDEAADDSAVPAHGRSPEPAPASESDEETLTAEPHAAKRPTVTEPPATDTPEELAAAQQVRKLIAAIAASNTNYQDAAHLLADIYRTAGDADELQQYSFELRNAVEKALADYIAEYTDSIEVGEAMEVVGRALGWENLRIGDNFGDYADFIAKGKSRIRLVPTGQFIWRTQTWLWWLALYIPWRIIRRLMENVEGLSFIWDSIFLGVLVPVGLCLYFATTLANKYKEKSEPRVVETAQYPALHDALRPIRWVSVVEEFQLALMMARGVPGDVSLYFATHDEPLAFTEEVLDYEPLRVDAATAMGMKTYESEPAGQRTGAAELLADISVERAEPIDSDAGRLALLVWDRLDRPAILEQYL
ncbi:hypothetical protein ACFPVT_05170 [Corynebacterium choanae]|uniref:Uncharacterized protein n=1 Tax=Corynebacterium choanae TaxID=1862358 RepID=A0A3G6J3P1_9CORY|nr:hypothetical protein [Corynebacterium choanae]AZA12685.1 hypothetical protein CCHOA_01285 [Corynebacterium choanae]